MIELTEQDKRFIYDIRQLCALAEAAGPNDCGNNIWDACVRLRDATSKFPFGGTHDGQED